MFTELGRSRSGKLDCNRRASNLADSAPDEVKRRAIEAVKFGSGFHNFNLSKSSLHMRPARYKKSQNIRTFNRRKCKSYNNTVCVFTMCI